MKAKFIKLTRYFYNLEGYEDRVIILNIPGLGEVALDEAMLHERIKNTENPTEELKALKAYQDWENK